MVFWEDQDVEQVSSARPALEKGTPKLGAGKIMKAEQGAALESHFACAL